MQRTHRLVSSERVRVESKSEQKSEQAPVAQSAVSFTNPIAASSATQTPATKESSTSELVAESEPQARYKANRHPPLVTPELLNAILLQASAKGFVVQEEKRKEQNPHETIMENKQIGENFKINKVTGVFHTSGEKKETFVAMLMSFHQVHGDQMHPNIKMERESDRPAWIAALQEVKAAKNIQYGDNVERFIETKKVAAPSTDMPDERSSTPSPSHR